MKKFACFVLMALTCFGLQAFAAEEVENESPSTAQTDENQNEALSLFMNDEEETKQAFVLNEDNEDKTSFSCDEDKDENASLV